MSRQFGFSRNATKTYNVRNMPTSTISSSSVASDAHVDVIRTWLLNRMIDADVRSTLGYAEICRQHVNAHVALVQPLFAAAIGAAAVIPAAHANPAAPGGLDNAHATAIDNHFQALVAPALAAAPAVHPNYVYDVSQHVEPSEAEYNFVEWQFLQALAHSGFTSQGQYNQVISFRVMALPTPPLYYTLEVDEIIDNFPQGVTPFNVGAYFATTIALNAKNAGIVWRWGLVHGCPDAIPWAGFATWEYISRDSKLISQEYVPELRAMSADAIAKKQVVAYVDHDRALDQDYETIEQGIQHMNIKHERNRSRRADLERKRKGLNRKKYRRGDGSDDESNGDSTYFRSQ